MIPYKRLFPVVFIVFCAINCFSQENIEKKNKLTDWVTEIFHVSPTDQQTKDGIYQAFYRRKTLVADGKYNKGKRMGTWHFYGSKGALLQTYNFDNDSLEYEAREKQPSDFHYLVDNVLTDSDRVTKPLRIGGRYYGFLPYLNAFKTPFDTYNSPELYVALVELLISPMGRLAEYKVRVVSPLSDYDQTINLSLSFFTEEQKQFIPATLNYRPILSRIIIKCKVTDDGGLDFY
jgi:hypothetical protein